MPMPPLMPIPFYAWSEWSLSSLSELVLTIEDAYEAPNAHPYLFPGLQINRAGLENADAAPDAHP